MRVGALLRMDRTRPPPPIEALPMGRAAVTLLSEGIEVVLVDAARNGLASGYRATPSAWVPVNQIALHAAYDRYPRPRHLDEHNALLDALKGIVIGNPPSIRALSRDKLISQHHLVSRGIQMPAIEDDPDRFPQRLRAWGTAFAKPRYGAVGAGVQRVSSGDAVAPQRHGALGTLEPTLLQKAVAPPEGWAGIATRTLVQRDANQRWVCAPTVARRSATDWVVNVARGAEPVAAQDVLDASTVSALQADALATAQALADHPDGERLVEIGVDAMVDVDGKPWVIEVNTRPWGRLSALVKRDPARWMATHVAVCARPFQALAALAGHSTP